MFSTAHLRPNSISEVITLWWVISLLCCKLVHPLYIYIPEMSNCRQLLLLCVKALSTYDPSLSGVDHHLEEVGEVVHHHQEVAVGEEEADPHRGMGAREGLVDLQEEEEEGVGVEGGHLK